ncbi:MAG: hypothetical protein RSB09_00880 [Clostridia bacterium]
MKERFKRYLEREFRAIPPTEAAMEYRQKTLAKMLDRAQELRIKGIVDEELIYDMVIDELGDFRTSLMEFSNKVNKNGQRKRQAVFFISFIVAAFLALVTAYLIVSFAVPGIWGKSWLILVGGIFVGIIIVCLAFVALGITKKRFIVSRVALIVAEVLASVFIYLILEILFKVQYDWLTFLGMVIVLVGSDAFMAMFFKSKSRFFMLAAFMEVFCVMLYVILGIVIPGGTFWHPGWLLCLVGIVGIFVEIIVLIARRTKKSEIIEDKAVEKANTTDEQYYTMWKD